MPKLAPYDASLIGPVIGFLRIRAVKELMHQESRRNSGEMDLAEMHGDRAAVLDRAVDVLREIRDGG